MVRIFSMLVSMVKVRGYRSYLFPYLLGWGVFPIFCMLFLFQSYGLAWHKGNKGSNEPSSSLEKLSCGSVHSIERELFKVHLVYNEWDIELRSRVVSQFIKMLDKDSIYLLRGDVEFMGGLLTKFINRSMDKRKLVDEQGSVDPSKLIVGSRFSQVRDCREIREVFNLFVTRLNERFIVIRDYLQSSQFEGVEKGELSMASGEKRGHFESSQEADTFVKKMVQFEVAQYMDQADVDVDDAKSYIFQFYKRLRDSENENDRPRNKSKIFLKYLKAFVHGLDPHSKYLSSLETDEAQIISDKSFFGIGIEARYSEDGQFVEVYRLFPGGSALESGKIKPKDKIIAVGNSTGGWEEFTRGRTLGEFISFLRGGEGTTVPVKVMREEVRGNREYFVVPLIRKNIEMQEAKASMRYVERDFGGERKVIGVLSLPDFYSVKEMRKDMKRLLGEAKEKKVSGIILDLSNNQGGFVDSCIVVVGAFIYSGDVAAIWSKDGEYVRYSDRTGEDNYYGPLIVLTNRSSTSVSEIVAGTLQDYKRAIIVGEGQTFGKGSTQHNLSFHGDLGSAMVTFGLFFTPSGRAVQYQGVSSDISFLSPHSSEEIERNLENSIKPFEDIEPFLSPSKYTGEGDLWKKVEGATIARLRKRSQMRMKGSGRGAALSEEDEYLKEANANVHETINIMLDYVGD